MTVGQLKKELEQYPNNMQIVGGSNMDGEHYRAGIIQRKLAVVYPNSQYERYVDPNSLDGERGEVVSVLLID
jgi:hypothetical protein